MAVQTYVKRNNAYGAALTVPGADADQVLGVYQVFISLVHEWGNPVFNHSRLRSIATAGDTEISVVDGTQFVANEHIVFLDGRPESVQISAIDGNTLTVSALTKTHNPGVYVSVEQVATRASANNYTYSLTADNLESSGQHKVRWRYVQSGASSFSDVFLQVYQPYLDSGTFFDIHADLETDFDDFFDGQERVVRNIINTFCGQPFDYFPEKTLIFDGSGKNSLYLGTRLERFNTIYLRDDYSDITPLVIPDPSSKFYLRLSGDTSAPIPSNKITTASQPNWGNRSEFEVIGDWGWEQVPQNVSQAAEILIADAFNDDSQYPKHGVIETYMDTHRMRFDSTILGTTGNTDADVLLMDYTLFILGEI